MPSTTPGWETENTYDSVRSIGGIVNTLMIQTKTIVKIVGLFTSMPIYMLQVSVIQIIVSLS